MKVPLALLALVAALASMAPAQSRFSTLYTFTDGYPLAISGFDGVIYGAFQGADSCGYIFSLQPMGGDPAAGPWKETIIHSFGGAGDACGSSSALLPGPGGALYGLAGALYEMRPPAEPGGAWSERVDYSLSSPTGNLVHGPADSFYVLNADGGTYFAGELLQLMPPAGPGASWTGVDVFDFQGGEGPVGLNSLTAASNGQLYGTSEFGGDAHGQFGTVFQLNPPSAAGSDWTMNIIHNFGTGSGGGDPIGVTPGSDGTLYGVTCGAGLTCGHIEQGSLGAKVVFGMTPPAAAGGPWTYTVLANFYGHSLDSPPVLRGGNLYGTFELPTGGAVFELQPPSTAGASWTVKYLHLFTDGQIPFGPLVMDENGVLYGTTGSVNNSSQTGTVYRIEIQ